MSFGQVCVTFIAVLTGWILFVIFLVIFKLALAAFEKLMSLLVFPCWAGAGVL
jgi:hypothetical protein